MGAYFGTDGIRGVAGDLLTPEFAVQVGRAAAVVLAQKAGPHPLFVIGRDTRLSGPMLEAALTAGLTSGGARVEIAGVIPTPGLASLVHQRGANAGVVISASHNPFADNGIKFFSDAGTKLSDEEEAEIEAHIQHHDLQSLAGADFGSAEQLEGAVEGYVWDVVKRIPLDLSGMKIALDCAHGAMHLAAPLALEESGARVTVLFDQPDGTNINAGCGSTHMAALQKVVADDGFDLGLAFDGDGDRVLAVDAAGNLVDGDFIIAILAKHLKAQGKLRADTVVTTVMTNLGFHLAMEREGIDVIVTAVGDRYVVAEMLKGDYLLGGEQSGHIINRDVSTTGDGLATSLLLLQALRQMDVPLAEAATVMERLPQKLVNVARPRPDRVGRGRGGVGGGRRGDPPPRRKRPRPRAPLRYGAAGARDGGGADAGRRRRRLRSHRRRRRRAPHLERQLDQFEIRAGEVVAYGEQRLAGLHGEGVGTAVDDVQGRRMPALAPALPCLGCQNGKLRRDGDDLDAEGIEQQPELRLTLSAEPSEGDDGALEQAGGRDPDAFGLAEGDEDGVSLGLREGGGQERRRVDDQRLAHGTPCRS